MANKTKFNVKLKYQRGFDEDWDGWHYRVNNWSSGPYPTIKEALTDAAEHIQEGIELDSLTKKTKPK